VVDNNIDGVGETCTVTGEYGPCAVGAMACINGNMECEQLVAPVDETCNLIDDDCDGEVDEELGGEPCNVPGVFGACSVGAQQCENGGFICTQTVFSASEICNLEDTDCNGIVDDGCGCSPEGATQPCGIGTGECQEGLITCTDGEWSFCDGVMPVPELCDGLDNNCDGVIDDGNPEGGSSCSVPGQQGPCEAGITQCVGGGVDCTQTVFSQAEICDGLDNDCDGQVDNGNPGGGMACTVPGEQGLCAVGETECSGGGIICNQTVTSVTEVCGDGLDNDCDGSVDEPPCACTPGESQVCGTDVGRCVSGLRYCNAGGTWDLACLGGQGPITETCNNIDDDCDGVVDDNVTRSCYTGAAGTENVGVCHGGTQTCTSGTWSAGCTGQQTPTTEICNGLDDDCDGQVDESGTWVYDPGLEPNDHWEAPILVGGIDPWYTQVSITSSFSYSTDQDFFWWHMANYNDAPLANTIWQCSVSGLDVGQTVHVMVGVESNIYPGTGPWDWLYFDSTGGGNGRQVWLSFTSGGFNMSYGVMVGVLMGSGFGPCTNHTYTLTCQMHH